MTESTHQAATDAFATLESAWNSADGAAYGSVFAEDADFVDIRGTHHTGRGAIAGGHDAILRSIYAGSTVRYSVDATHEVGDGAVLAMASATLDAPTGPLEGTHHSTITALLLQVDGSWQIRAFHNTLVSG